MAFSPSRTSLSHRRALMGLCVALSLGAAGRLAGAADLDVSYEQFQRGQYEQCLESAREAIADWSWRTDWRMLEIESLMALGRYEEAAAGVEAALRSSRPDFRLLRSAYRAYLHSGRPDQAQAMLAMTYRMASFRQIEYLNSPEAVALGQALLLRGVEPRLVLENFYNRAIEKDPNCLEAYLAAGSLATAKQDYELAAEQYREALKRFGDEPDAYVGLAKALYHSDRQAMIAAIDAAVHVNPRHAPALLLLAEHQIDCEDYQGATKSLGRVLAVNPHHPDAWAYKSVLAFLDADSNAVDTHRAKALEFWPTNPRVDYLIGRKLSQKYHFSQGAACQRRAIEADPNYLPSKVQLAQDLLRLGNEIQGWRLADEVNQKDPYNVEAYNLANLRDKLSEFETLTAEGLVLKMNRLEADVYGDRVLKLLQEARSALCRKYGLELNHPITVEMFADQQDFAVRTFGMPGGDGFLGVCFGDVITATSPRTERLSNWEATLWHEFAHTVTLNLTANRMPRWLSEGISVYEERQENPTWGQQMTPEYRRMILAGELTPVTKLSTVFMSPPSPLHLQFAYYESSLAVEFLVERSGFEAILAILADLAKGMKINAAIARHAGPLKEIEKEFEAFVRKRTEDLAPGVDWERPGARQLDPTDHEAVAQWRSEHPNSLWALHVQAQQRLAERKWKEAKEPLARMISLYPDHVGEGNPYRLLAEAHRNLGETEQEIRVLGELAARSADAADAYERLVEIGTEQRDWPMVVENGERYLAVYPMLAGTYQRLGRAYEELGDEQKAAASYRRLLLLNPVDPVDVNYRLARLLQQREPTAAKRHILEALADAPRFREGHRLLLAILEAQNPRTPETTGEKEPLP